MKSPPFRTLHALIEEGRPDGYPVAIDGERIVGWGEFSKLVQARRKGSHDVPRRVLLGEQSALNFLADLLAVIADGDIAVLPPNFQPQTLSALSSLPVPNNASLGSIELYTSGSSGEPKCVSKTLTQLESECRVQETCWGQVADDAIVIATTPYHHIYGLLFRLLWPLCAGRVFDNATMTDPAMLFQRLNQLKSVVLVSSPAHLSRLPLPTEQGSKASPPKLVFSSGGPLRADAAQHVLRLWGTSPVEIFGSTESGGIAWRRQTDEVYWTPLPGVQIDTAHDGALVIRSPFISEPAGHRMEDVAEIRNDGRFVLNGRLDRIVKIEEKRLSLPEMETWLALHASVSACAAAPIPIDGRTFVGVVVVTRADDLSDRKLLIAELREHLNQKFDAVLLPRRWRFVEQLPYNERGKLPVENLVALLTKAL